ncbi:hypothetical protein ACHWQZ_G003563 [Mnemiopsis leidyi]
MIDQLKSTWDVLEGFVGVNLTEPIVEHFRKYDNDNCGEGDNILDLLGEMVGEKMIMTRGILQHFRDYHEDDEPCEDDSS